MDETTSNPPAAAFDAELLRPGQRVRVIKQMQLKGWTSETIGTVQTFEQRKTGSWYAHGKDDKLWLDRLTLKKQDGEIVTLNLDGYCRVEDATAEGLCIVTRPPHDPQWEVTPGEVVALREAGGCDLLLDVRTPDEIATASIQGAEEIPMQVLAARMDEIAALKDGKVVVFCHAGVRSRRVTEFLRQRGFADAWSMQGGIDAWSQQIDPAVPRY